MTRAMAREGCARATRLSTRSRSVDDAARGPSVRRLGGRFAKTTVTGGRRRAVARAADGGVVPSNFKKFTEIFANLFPIWTILAAVAGVMRPNTFSFMTSGAYTGCLALLMFSMGITLTIDDFKRVFAKPRVIGLGFFACYALMPALAFVIGNALGLSGPLLAGLILVGSINGGQASNLCAYIAKGDVALSVLMTTATTVGCIFMTPLICKLALGAVVDVDAMGMAISTIQVVLVPVVLGLTLNKFTPKFCRRVEPISPVVGVTATIILVGGAVANCAEGIVGAGFTLQAAAFLLHLIGGLGGYWIMRAFKYGETTCRTVAIETAMKSSAFGFLLASLHFPEYLVARPVRRLRRVDGRARQHHGGDLAIHSGARRRVEDATRESERERKLGGPCRVRVFVIRHANPFAVLFLFIHRFTSECVRECSRAAKNNRSTSTCAAVSGFADRAVADSRRHCSR